MESNKIFLPLLESNLLEFILIMVEHVLLIIYPLEWVATSWDIGNYEDSLEEKMKTRL